MKTFFDYNSSGIQIRGAFINTKEEPCSIYESGRMIYNCLKNNKSYSIEYFSLDQINIDVLTGKGQVVPLIGASIDQGFDFWIFNWHFTTMARHLKLEQIARLPGLKFAILLELEPGNPLRYVDIDIFDGYIAIDPAAEASGKIFSFPRPLEGTPRRPRPIRDVPVISSFGFGTPAKGFEQVVAAVNKEFQRAVVRVNIPAGAYTGGADSIHATNYPKYLEKMCRAIARKGVDVQFTYDFLSPNELIDWCSDSDLNCFLYTRRQPGLSATTDQAITSGQPLITGTNDTFRHIHRYIPPYPLLSLREALTVTPPLVRRLQKDWSSEAFSRAFQRMLHAYGLGRSESIAGLNLKQPTTLLRRLLVLTSRSIGTRGILDYETRLADCIGRSGTYAVLMATAASPAEQAAAINTHQPWAVLIVEDRTLPDGSPTPSMRVEGPIIRVVKGSPAPSSAVQAVERLPIIPYYTVFVPSPERPRIYLLGFAANRSTAEAVLSRIAVELKGADVLVEVPDPSAESAKDLHAALITLGKGVYVHLVSTPRNGEEAIGAFATSSLVIAYHDAGRSEELEDLVSLALATERGVVFTDAAHFPQFPSQDNTIERCKSLGDRIAAGISGQIGLLSRYAEGETYSRVQRLLSPAATGLADQEILFPDETFTAFDGDPEFYVRAAYFRMLGRAPDPAGLAHRINAMKDGLSPSELLGILLLSAEGRAYAVHIAGEDAVPSDIDAADPETFLRAAYRVTLSREIDDGALNDLIPSLAAGTSRTRILGDLLLSPEGAARHADLVRSWNDGIKKRRMAEDVPLPPQPEADGLPLVGDGVSAAFDGDPELYVRAAYFRMLGRAPDLSGLAHQVEAMNDGGSASELLGVLLLSAEGRAYAVRMRGEGAVPSDIDSGDPEAFLRAAYHTTLSQEIDDEALNALLPALAAGTSRTSILGDLLLSQEGVAWHADLVRSWNDDIRERRLAEYVPPAQQPEAESIWSPVTWHELATRHGDDFIHGIYWRLLYRSPDPDGFASRAARLGSGETEAGVAGDILLSGEARGKLKVYWPAFAGRFEELFGLDDTGFTAGAYRLFQGRTPMDDILAAVRGRLGSSLSRSGLLGELLLSAEGLARLSARKFAETVPVEAPVMPKRSLIESVAGRRIFVLTAATEDAGGMVFSPLQRQLIVSLIEQVETVRLVRWSPLTRCLVMLTRQNILALGTSAVFRLCAASHPALDDAPLHVDVPGSPDDWLLVVGSIRARSQTEYLHEMNVVVEAKRLGLSTAFIFEGAAALRRSASADAQAQELHMQALLLADLVVPVSTLAKNDIVIFLRQDQGADVGPRIEKISTPRIGDMREWPIYVQRLRKLLTAALEKASRLGPIYVAQVPGDQGSDPNGNHLVTALADLGGNALPIGWNTKSRKFVTFCEDAHASEERGRKTAWLLITAMALVAINDWKAVFAFASEKELRIAALLPATRIDEALYDVLLNFDKVFAPTPLSLEHLRSFLRSTRERLTCAEDRFKLIQRPYERPHVSRETARLGDDAQTTALFVTDGRMDALAFARKTAAAFAAGLKVTICNLDSQPFPIKPKAGVHSGLSLVVENDIEACLANRYDFAIVVADGAYGASVSAELASRGIPVMMDIQGDPVAADQPGIVPVDIRDAEKLSDLLESFTNPGWRSILQNEDLNRQPRTWRAYAADIVTEFVFEEQRNLANVLPNPVADITQVLPYLVKRPKLSICISTYRRAEWVALSLRNIFQQIGEGRSGIEVLVVDNASPDHTPQAVEPFRARSEFSYYRNPKNVGMLGNLAVTAQRARGEYIWILGDDDLVRPGAIDRVLQVIDAHPRIGLIYLNYGYSSESDPTSIKNLDAYLNGFNVLEPKGPDSFGPIRSIAAKNENFFTAIYAHVFRRDHALRAYCQDTSGRTFSTMANCIPTAKYVLEWMMDDDGYWVGDNCMVVNSNVSWAAYGPMFDLEHLPKCWDLAEWKGTSATDIDKRRSNRLWLVEMMWRDLFENDKVGNADYLNVEQIINRLKHLTAFAERVPTLRAIYEKAYAHQKTAAKLPPEELFRAFVSQISVHRKIS